MSRTFQLTILYKDQRGDICYQGMEWATAKLDHDAFVDLFIQLGDQRNLPPSSFVILNHFEMDTSP